MFSIEIGQGDIYQHRTAGGGGWGDPLERDPSAVADDVLNEKVSVEAALRLYGVAVADDGSAERRSL
jgi:N-methylhydantoinase B